MVYDSSRWVTWSVDAHVIAAGVYHEAGLNGIVRCGCRAAKSSSPIGRSFAGLQGKRSASDVSGEANSGTAAG